MNTMRDVQKFLLTALVVEMLLLAPRAPAFAAPSVGVTLDVISQEASLLIIATHSSGGTQI